MFVLFRNVMFGFVRVCLTFSCLSACIILQLRRPCLAITAFGCLCLFHNPTIWAFLSCNCCVWLHLFVPQLSNIGVLVLQLLRLVAFVCSTTQQYRRSCLVIAAFGCLWSLRSLVQSGCCGVIIASLALNWQRFFAQSSFCDVMSLILTKKTLP